MLCVFVYSGQAKGLFTKKKKKRVSVLFLLQSVIIDLEMETDNACSS